MERKEYTLDEFEQELKNFVTGCGVKITNTNTEQVNQLFRNEAIVLRRIWRNEERECNITYYEKKFKDAFERAKKVIEYYKGHHRCDEASIEDLESIFPELKESEDEKIRKELLESFKYQQRESRTDKEWLNGIKLSEVVAWLEKQGEQKSTWNEDDERLCNASIRACQYMVENFENSTQDYEDAIDWLNSLKGRVQPQWKPSEEQMAHLVAAIEESDGNCILQSLYNDLKKL